LFLQAQQINKTSHMHVDRYVNVYRLEEFKILHCGLEEINQSKNDACGA